MQTAFILKAADGGYSAEASDLGFRVGEWPAQVEHDGQVFARPAQPERDSEGDVTHLIYRGARTTFTIWND